MPPVRSPRAAAAPRWCRRSRGTGPAPRRCAARLRRGGYGHAGAGRIGAARRWRCPARPAGRRLDSASTVSMMPAAAIRWPNAHLNAVAGGAWAPKTRRIAAASEASDCGVPLPCATIMPTSPARRPGVVEREFDRPRERVAIVADGEQALRVGRRAAAQHLAQDRGVALPRRGFGLEHQRRRAFAEEAAVAARVERAGSCPSPAGRRRDSRAPSAARSGRRGPPRARDRPRRCAAPPSPRSPPACRRCCGW